MATPRRSPCVLWLVAAGALTMSCASVSGLDELSVGTGSGSGTGSAGGGACAELAECCSDLGAAAAEECEQEYAGTDGVESLCANLLLQGACGSGTGSGSFTGSGTGSRTGTGSGSFTWSGSGTGTVTGSGSFTGSGSGGDAGVDLDDADAEGGFDAGSDVDARSDAGHDAGAASWSECFPISANVTYDCSTVCGPDNTVQGCSTYPDTQLALEAIAYWDDAYAEGDCNSFNSSTQEEPQPFCSSSDNMAGYARCCCGGVGSDAACISQ